MKKNNLLLITMVFLISALTIALIAYHFSANSGNWFSAIFIGILGGWAIVAPIIRIKHGSLPFLKIFAVLPVLVLPLMMLVKIMPDRSPAFLIVIPLFGGLSLSYLGWLHGLEFFALFKQSTWATLFNRSSPEKNTPCDKPADTKKQDQ